jgi:hypothetical protein
MKIHRYTHKHSPRKHENLKDILYIFPSLLNQLLLWLLTQASSLVVLISPTLSGAVQAPHMWVLTWATPYLCMILVSWYLEVSDGFLFQLPSKVHNLHYLCELCGYLAIIVPLGKLKSYNCNHVITKPHLKLVCCDKHPMTLTSTNVYHSAIEYVPTYQAA